MEHIARVRQWIGCVLCAVALALCALPPQGFAVVNLGTVSVAVPESVSVASGGSVSVSTSCSPAFSDQYPNCMSDYCPSGCDFSTEGQTGTACEERATGQCTCYGYNTARYYPTCTVASSDPSIARASWNDGVLTVSGFKPGTAVVTVYPSLRLFATAPASITVNVTGVGADSGSGGDSAVVDAGFGGAVASGGGAIAVVRQSDAAQAQVGSSPDGGSGSAASSGSGAGSRVVTLVSTIERAEAASSAAAHPDGAVEADDGSLVAHLDDPAVNVQSLLTEARGRNALLTLWGGTAVEAPDYVWEIAGTKLPADDDFAGVNLKVANVTGSATLEAALGGAAYSAFTIPGEGKLPSTMQLLWRTDAAIDNDQIVDVYLFDESAGSFKKVHSNLRTGEGYAVFNLIECGTYVVTTASGLEGVAVEAASDDVTPLAAGADEGVSAAVPSWAISGVVVLAAVMAVVVFVLVRGRNVGE